MPAMMPESEPNPSSSSTLASRIRAPGATPLCVPPDLAPDPATVDATCVPWPTWSTVLPESEKSFWAISTPLRSGCVSSTPVSSTATFTSVPSYPACQAVGAPICAVLLSRVALRRPSSHTWAIPGAVVRACPPRRPAVVSASQTSAAPLLGAVSASPRRAGRLRPTRTSASAIAACAVARFLVFFVYETISGTVARCASSYSDLSSPVTLNSRRSTVPCPTRGRASAGRT